MPSDAEIYGTCSKNHPWTPENTLYEKAGGSDPTKKRRRCRECRKIKRTAAQLNASKGDLDSFGSRGRRNRGVPERLPIVDKAVDEFAQALTHVKAHCFGKPEVYSDWEDENPPTAAEALEMCWPCPLFDLCREASRLETRGGGVWGGEVWLYGKRVHVDE